MNTLTRKIKDKLRYGLFLKSIQGKLASIGIDISPYYLMKEGINSFAKPEIKGNEAEYQAGFFGPEDMVQINETDPHFHLDGLLNLLEIGLKCYGIRHQNEIAAFFWISHRAFTYKTIHFDLKPNEASFTDMHTMEPFRGKNIAPYLRYQCMLILQQTGKDTFYSATEYFNTSAMKYKMKLNARKVKLNLFIRLFKKYQWHFTLKTY